MVRASGRGPRRAAAHRLRLMKHFEAVIFDMDGTLLDTERVAQEAFLAACADLGLTPRMDLLLRCVGAAAPIAQIGRAHV